MTWELAESGKHFITTVINGSDLVPTFSTASIDDLRSEVLYLFLLTGSGYSPNFQIYPLETLGYLVKLLFSGHSIMLVK
jgi:hypothetical protein